MSECVSASDLLGFLRRTLPEDQRAAVERHLDVCAECLELATLAAQSSIATRDDGLVPDDAADAPAIGPGTRIGRYEVGEPLGMGGMGMVYAARDRQLDRVVALKLVHPRIAGDPRAQLGLLREAQAMARITQPNVLTVYELGAFADTVFLVVERVDGVTLDRWLATPRRWRAIVDVFVQAARGLEAAHAAGLVHRDFKPSNALVGSDGLVRVFDFGVVRFTDTVAEHPELVGTPLYMAPEQLRGELATARSDQYAWCAALHEALFGALPTELGAQLPRRRGASNRVPRWLRDVIRRGLAADPAARYPSLHDARAALECGLQRRRRRALAATAALAACAVAATAWLGYARGIADDTAGCDEPTLGWTPARQLALAGSFYGTGLAYAPATWLRVERVLDSFAARWRAQFRDVCRAGPRGTRRAVCLERHGLVFAAVLDRLAAPDRELAEQVPRLLASLPDVAACERADGGDVALDPLTRARLNVHLRGVARVASYVAAGRAEIADLALEPVLRIAPTLGLPGAVAEADYYAGVVAARRGHYAAAAERLEHAMWSALAVGYDELVVAAASDLIHVLSYDLSRPVAARSFIELLRAAARRIDSPTARMRASREIGRTEILVGHNDTAQAELRLALGAAAAATPPDDVTRSAVLDDLALMARRRRDFAGAEAAAREALERFASALGTDHPRYAMLLVNHANALTGLGRTSEAIADVERATDLQARLLGPAHPELARGLASLGDLYNSIGDSTRARAVLTRGLEICEASLPADHALTTSIRHGLADAMLADNDLAGAERTMRAILAQHRAQVGATHHATSGAMFDLANVLVRRGALAEAAQLCGEVLAARPPGSEERPVAELCLTEIEIDRGRVTPAVRATLEGALAQLERRHDPQAGPLTAWARFTLARALPAAARPRAHALAIQARAALLAESGHYRYEVAQVEDWLRQH